MVRQRLSILLIAFSVITPIAANAKDALSLDAEVVRLEKFHRDLSARYEKARAEVEAKLAWADYFPISCNGRLTTQSNTPISTANRTAQATLYFTPYHGNKIALFTDGRWMIYTFTQRSIALTGLTAGANYDVFAYDNNGTVTLELSAAWASNTTRTDALTRLDGVWVKSSNTSRRYLGTFRSVTTTTTEDSATNRFVWSYCNRAHRSFSVLDLTNTWTYNGTAWRQANASTANLVSMVIGINEALVTARVHGVPGTATALTWASVGIGIDSTTTNSALLMGGAANPNLGMSASAEYSGYPGIGFHQLNWIETTDGTNTVTFWGDNNNARVRCGLEGWLEG